MTDLKQTNTKRKKWSWILGGALALTVAFVGFSIVGTISEREAAAAEQSDTTNIVTAFIGDLSSSATASGQIQAHRDAQLSLGVSGTVEDVLVREGDVVAEGDILIRLDPAALERAVAQAEQNLIIQEASLVELLDGASAADLASSQAGVDSAQASLENVQAGANQADIDAAQASLDASRAAYNEILEGADANSVAQAEANLRNAEATLRQAQSNYDEVSWMSNIGQMPQALELEQATNNYEAALASYNSASEGPSTDQIQQARANVVQAETNLQKLLDSPTTAELASAESQLAQAEAQLAALLDSASAEKVAIAEAQVEQARLNLADARENLEKASLTAPFDGTITAVHVAEGETANGLAAEIVDSNSLEVVLSVDEVDIGEIAVDQPAIITLETWPDEEITGEVVAIAPKALAGNSAIVAYEVRLSLNETDLPILVGMTANADLITSAKKDVLLAPNETITSNRAAGTYYVNIIVNNSDGTVDTEQVEVTIGLKDGNYTEITSGIQEGTRLSTITITASADEPSSGFFPEPPEGGRPFGGR